MHWRSRFSAGPRGGPLKGSNELVLAVTEYFGGRGFLCRLEPPAR